MITKLSFFALLFCLFSAVLVHAQAEHPLDAATLRNDTLILKDIIEPAVTDGLDQNQEPNWKVLGNTIQTRFDTSYVDRNITKAKIYYFYGQDWPKFTAAIVDYTNHYEWKDDLPLMNTNAQMILEHSKKVEELKAAQGWVKNAMDKAPGEGKYKATYEALGKKIKGK